MKHKNREFKFQLPNLGIEVINNELNQALRIFKTEQKVFGKSKSAYERSRYKKKSVIKKEEHDLAVYRNKIKNNL